MSPFFKDTIALLLQCAQRHASFEHSKVQISAFEAINDLVRSASRDTLDVVAQLITVRARRDEGPPTLDREGRGGVQWCTRQLDEEDAVVARVAADHHHASQVCTVPA